MVGLCIVSACFPCLLRRIVLKSNCDTPIDVWLVSGHHQKKQEEEEELPMGHPHAGMADLHVKHEADDMAGGLWLTAIDSKLFVLARHVGSLLQ